MEMIVGGMIVSGLMQAYQSEKASGASDAQLQEIQRTFDALVPPQYDMSIEDPPELVQDRLSRPIFGPGGAPIQWNMAAIKPEDLKLIGKYNPEIPAFVEEQAPELIQENDVTREGRDSQLRALRKFQEIGEGGYDPEYQQKVQEAARASQQEAQSRSASIMQDFARRGMGGSGMELAAKLGASSQAMDRSAQGNLSAATEAYRNQLSALSQGAQLGGQMRGEDQDLQARNNAVLNDFNKRLSANRQNYENQRVGALNDAQLRNLDMEQQLSNANITNRNNLAVQNQGRLDMIAKSNYGAAQDAQNRNDALAQWNYNSDAGERDYQNRINTALSEWKARERDNQNSLTRQNYDDLLAKAQGRSGIATQRSNAALGRGRDINSAIQGMANIGTNAYMRQQDLDQRALDRQAYGGSGGPKTNIFNYTGENDDDYRYMS